ncbi:MAG: hypothetical protein WCS65_14695 [Verrucomicrobiae bacterium]
MLSKLSGFSFSGLGDPLHARSLYSFPRHRARGFSPNAFAPPFSVAPPPKPPPLPGLLQIPGALTRTHGAFRQPKTPYAADLDINAFFLFRALCRHITTTVDHCQQIYPNRASEREILDSLGLRDRSMTLPGCLRWNPHVVNLAAAFLEDPADRRAFLAHVRSSRSAITETRTSRKNQNQKLKIRWTSCSSEKSGS